MAYRVIKGRADLERLLGDDTLRRIRIPDMASCRFCLLASDFDEFDPASHPPSEQILGHSPIPLRFAQTRIGRQDARVYSDMTYYTDPRSHAGVFDSGTNNWIPALVCAGCPSNIVQTMTANLLWLFGQAPAGTLRPSTPNWQRIYSSRT